MRLPLILLFITCLSVISSCSNGKNKQVPIAKNGVLDLRGRDFKKEGLVKLSGEWEFYWEQFLESDDFSRENPPEKTALLPVPGCWDNFSKDGKKFPGSGYATYRLKVLMDETEDSFDFKFLAISTAYTVYVNGNKISSVGKPGKTPETSFPEFKSRLVDISCSGNEQEIIIHVSNFHHTQGGIWDGILFGIDEDIRQSIERSLCLEHILFGSIFVMGLYYLGLFIDRKKDKSFLYLAILCLVISVRILVVGELFFMDIFPATGFELLMKMRYLTFYLGGTVTGLLVYSLFPRDYLKWFLYGMLFFGTIFSSIVLVTPAKIFSVTLIPFQGITIFYGLYTIYVLILALIRKREGAGILLVGFFALFAAAVINIFVSNNIIYTGNYVSPGFFVFVFSQAYILSRRFSNAFYSVEILSGDLETKNRELSKLDKLKDEFLANTSHELRTPLNGIIGISESLTAGFENFNMNAVKQNLIMISTSGRRLAALVNDILDFSKLKNSDIQLSRGPVDMRMIADTVLTLSEQLKGTKELVLKNSITEVPPVLGDENRLQQVLLNLVSNAVKFTESGCVEITAESFDRWVRVAVSDTGIGIPPEHIDSIFLSFEQGDGSTERQYGGTGLGLSISKQLVELHGGEISVRSTPGKGSTFTITLPVSGEEPAAALSLPAAAMMNSENQEAHEAAVYYAVPVPTVLPDLLKNMIKEGTEIHILAVDDDAINLQVILNQLSMENFSIATASTGKDALAVLGTDEKINLVLLDIMMPGMSGYEVCKRIRETQEPVNFPVILLTAKNHANDLATGFSAGANDYITKPFTREELASRVLFHLGLSIYSKKLTTTMIELEGLNEDLEDKVIERTEELLIAKEEVEVINEDLTEKNDELETANRIGQQAMKMAVSVQSKFLPGSAPESNTWDIAFLFKPMSGVSGDFYDFYDFDGILSGVGLFDVSGHGISSGLVTMIAKSVLFRRFHFGLLLKLNKVLELANKELFEEIGEVDNYLTGILLRFHEEGKIDYVNAGHPGILYKNRQTNETTIMTGENGESISGMYLGMPMMEDSYESISFAINRGDYLLLYTDCLSESKNSENSEFGSNNILTAFQEAPNGSSDAVLKYIYDEFTAFTGTDSLKDDLTVIVIRKK
ncbi:MAG: response regulator [bacterium]|nr:response regulator [bacterium]